MSITLKSDILGGFYDGSNWNIGSAQRLAKLNRIRTLQCTIYVHVQFFRLRQGNKASVGRL